MSPNGINRTSTLSRTSSTRGFVSGERHLMTQAELNDLIRDLDLTKEKAELLAIRLQQFHCLHPRTQVTIYRSRNKDLLQFYKKADHLYYCDNINGLFDAIEYAPYDRNEWHLFIVGTKNSLKAILVHNANKKPSIPIAHAEQQTKNCSNTIYNILLCIKYNEHKWKICGDLKIIGLLMGMQAAGYDKSKCFLCLWDSRTIGLHYVRKNWRNRNYNATQTENVSRVQLVSPKDILLPPLYIKLGLIKNFVKALNREGPAFDYLINLFPQLACSKIKEEIFIGNDLKKLTIDRNFTKLLTITETSAWTSLQCAFHHKFLGDSGLNSDFKIIIDNLLKNYHKFGARMSLKTHFLHSHLDFITEKLGNICDVEGERLHQDLEKIKNMYQGLWNEDTMSDYCWTLIRETAPRQ